MASFGDYGSDGALSAVEASVGQGTFSTSIVYAVFISFAVIIIDRIAYGTRLGYRAPPHTRAAPQLTPPAPFATGTSFGSLRRLQPRRRSRSTCSPSSWRKILWRRSRPRSPARRPLSRTSRPKSRRLLGEAPRREGRRRWAGRPSACVGRVRSRVGRGERRRRRARPSGEGDVLVLPWLVLGADHQAAPPRDRRHPSTRLLRLHARELAVQPRRRCRDRRRHRRRRRRGGRRDGAGVGVTCRLFSDRGDPSQVRALVDAHFFFAVVRTSHYPRSRSATVR